MQRPTPYQLEGAVAALIASIILSDPAPAAEYGPAQNGGSRVINITSDSIPGWLPSEDLERKVRSTAIEFMSDLDGGKYADAYAFLADVDRKNQPLSSFSDRIRQFNAKSGPVLGRQIVTVTWTNNPATTPFPGVYAAIDIVGRFTNIDRHCGYLVLYQAPSNSHFEVMRQEDNFLDNATAADIAKKGSAGAVDKAWAALSAHCPGYKQQTDLPAQPAAATSAPLPEAAGETVGYGSVNAALVALHAKPGVVFTVNNGWTVADDEADKTIWSFPPVGHPAYPSAVKRQVVEEAGAINLKMSVQCEATKQTCDDLVRSFQQLNEQMSARMRSHR